MNIKVSAVINFLGIALFLFWAFLMLLGRVELTLTNGVILVVLLTVGVLSGCVSMANWDKINQFSEKGKSNVSSK